MTKQNYVKPIEELVTADLRQCLIAIKDAEIFKQRTDVVIEILKEEAIIDKGLAHRIFDLTLKNPGYKAFYEDSDKHTSIEQFWNRHDVFHAVSSLLLGLQIIKVLRKTRYNKLIDERFIPTITLALLWHDALRGLLIGDQHALLSVCLINWIENVLTQCVNEGLVKQKESEHILIRTLRCMAKHNSEDKCSDFDTALVRVAEVLDCDEHRSYISKLHSWEQLLRRNQLTHVLGTAFIEKVEINYSGQPERPVLITLHVKESSRMWNISNWFQVQDRVKRKIESTGFGFIFRLKVLYKDGFSELYDFN